MTHIEKRLRQVLHRAQRIVALTGAGISAESGVPTFRDAQTGYWEQFDPGELATPEAFRRNPRRVWAWYAQRRRLAEQAQPNAGHRALVDWERQLGGLRVVTQNVDGLHQRAGSQQVTELHGNIHRDRVFEGAVDGASDAPELPRCPCSGGLLRPDVVWFGEALPEGTVEAAVAAVREADLVLSVGTSSLVQPAASLPLEALERDIPVLEVNREPTPLTPVADWSLRGSAGEILPALVGAATEAV
ncbi:SIR2 family NAD-dependent protein deacylase [Halorhodospira halophila]|uniref:NAD-dependent protein deacylase n=1 Tax=Halorhodospira halophila (strain DSM 244 / SL1) TaxID=349124 RepID=A1WXE9_HALHL|nr:NAD-dependent deacylase [Halorhodospira halophila]ABM62361.1 Silent information regulator protein Sir2 [Halorhodospira halophila SL1]MBK1730096.1 NAD-dependent deacylase [Halorhodospira halophila]